MKRILLTLVVLAAVPLSSCAAAGTTPPRTLTSAITTSTPTTYTTALTTTTTAAAVTTSAVVTTTTATKSTVAVTSTVFPAAFYVPVAAPYTPTGTELDLFQYELSLINADRQTAGLPPVTLSYNAAAEKHAQNMFANYYGSHWDTDGTKPYMRYTFEGGLNDESENNAYSGWVNPSDNPAHYQSINVRDEIAALEHIMMYDDAGSNWAHRDTILNKSYTMVSLGIAYDGKRLAIVQQFEGKYIDYYNAPAISNSNLTLLGKLTSADIKINNVSIAWDPPLQTLTNAQLTTDPAYTDGYSLGDRLNFVIPPAPAGQQYTNLSPQAIIAGKWEINNAGQFSIQANINPSLTKGKGVYTIVIVALINGESVNITNYSTVIN